MSVLLEHDTIVKSRRALIISSVVVIALHYVQFVLTEPEIEIFKLRVAVSKGGLIIAAKLSTAYLLCIFILQVMKLQSDSVLKIGDKFFEELRRDIKLAKADRTDDQANDIELSKLKKYDLLVPNLKEKSEELTSIMSDVKKQNVLLNYLIDVAPALILAFFALTGWHTFFTS